MNIVSVEGRGVFVINIFPVRPENQDALVTLMREGVSTDMPGLLSVKLLKSRDGKKVINHMLWASREAFKQAMTENPEIAATRRRVHELIDGAGPDEYEIIDVK
jgi:heme-degrading monooxygenase HmoA